MYRVLGIQERERERENDFLSLPLYCLFLVGEEGDDSCLGNGLMLHGSGSMLHEEAELKIQLS